MGGRQTGCPYTTVYPSNDAAALVTAALHHDCPGWMCSQLARLGEDGGVAVAAAGAGGGGRPAPWSGVAALVLDGRGFGAGFGWVRVWVGGFVVWRVWGGERGKQGLLGWSWCGMTTAAHRLLGVEAPCLWRSQVCAAAAGGVHHVRHALIPEQREWLLSD